MDLEEIKIYTKRVEDRYYELLTYRDLINTQIKIEENNLLAAKEEARETINEIKCKIKQEQNKLDSLKQEQEIFVKGLRDRDEQLKLKSKQLYEQERTLQIREQEAEKAKEKYEQGVIKNEEIKKEIKETKSELDRKIIALDIEKKNLGTVAKEIDTTRKDELKYIEVLDKRQESLNQLIDENRLLKEHFIKGQAENKRIRDEIEKDRRRLQSQQISLKLAIDEARKKGVW